MPYVVLRYIMSSDAFLWCLAYNTHYFTVEYLLQHTPSYGMPYGKYGMPGLPYGMPYVVLRYITHSNAFLRCLTYNTHYFTVEYLLQHTVSYGMPYGRPGMPYLPYLPYGMPYVVLRYITPSDAFLRCLTYNTHYFTVEYLLRHTPSYGMPYVVLRYITHSNAFLCCLTYNTAYSIANQLLQHIRAYGMLYGRIRYQIRCIVRQ